MTSTDRATRTPGPWEHIAGWIYAEQQDACIATLMFDEAGTRNGGPMSNAELEANAEFVVTACNAHDALVEALMPLAQLGRAIDERMYPAMDGTQLVSVPYHHLRVAMTALAAATELAEAE